MPSIGGRLYLSGVFCGLVPCPIMQLQLQLGAVLLMSDGGAVCCLLLGTRSLNLLFCFDAAGGGDRLDATGDWFFALSPAASAE